MTTFRSVHGTEYPRAGRLVVRARARPRGCTRSPAAAIARGAIRAVDRLELLQRPARADRHAGEGGLREVRGHLGLLAQPLVEALEQRAPAGEHDPAVHDVRGELGRGAVQRLLDRFDDLVERFFERLAD